MYHRDYNISNENYLEIRIRGKAEGNITPNGKGEKLIRSYRECKQQEQVRTTLQNIDF